MLGIQQQCKLEHLRSFFQMKSILRYGHIRIPSLPRPVQTNFSSLPYHINIRTQSTNRAVLLVDGDSQGLVQVKAAVNLLRTKGALQVKVLLFAEPAARSKLATLVLESATCEFRPVPRLHGSKGEEVDRAMTIEAELLKQTSEVTMAGFLSCDADIVPAAHSLAACGKQVFGIVDSSRVGLANLFAQAGVEVLQLQLKSKSTLPKMKALLHADGKGSVVPSLSEWNLDSDPTEIKVFLQENGYVRGLLPPLAPGIVKFWWHCDRNQDLTIWPLSFAIAYMRLHVSTRAKLQFTPDLNTNIFVLPVGATTTIKLSAIEEANYGTATCRSVALGGGPFFIEDSKDCFEVILRRLGFLDDSLNADVEEAEDVFWSKCKNKAVLRQAGIRINQADPALERHLHARRALLSDSFGGQLQICPTWIDIRQLLRSKNLLKSAHATKEEFLDAAKWFSNNLGLPHKKTLNGTAQQLTEHLMPVNPMKRSLSTRGLG